MTRGVTELIERWEAKKAELSRYHANVDPRPLIDDVLADLASLAESEAPVTLSEASQRTGYSSDHLSRLIKQEKLTNLGKKHAPRVRLSECPVKAGVLASRYANAYHPETDARSLVSSRQ